MKKLMFAAVAIAAGVAVADVTSANVVGYQAIPVPSDFSLFTITFENIDGNEYDLRQIIPADVNGTPLTNSKNKFKIQKMNLGGGYTTQYQFTTASGKGWCDMDGNALTDATTIKFKAGEAMCLENKQTGDSTLLVSGAVKLVPVTYGIETDGFSLIGNLTPVEVDLRDIVPCSDAEGKTPFSTSKNKVKVQKMNQGGGYTTQYQYTTASSKGWCDMDGNALTDATTIKLAPGESLCVENKQGATVYLRFPTVLK